MKYQSHTNPTEIHCHKCGEEITLKAQYILDSVILCGDCNENEEEMDLDE